MRTTWVLVCLVSAVLLTPTVCAAEDEYSLLLAEFGKASDGDQTQTLARYRFKSGLVVSREDILTRKTSDLRYDLGENQIYRNRYVITSWGDVVDLATGQLLFKSNGELVTIDNVSNSVIIRVERDDDSGIYAFNLSSGRYQRVRQPGLWAIEGTASPNGQLLAIGDAGKIWLQHPSGETTLLGNNFSRSGTVECSSSVVPPFVWLDDGHLVTQRGNGHLVVVDAKGHVEPLVVIPDVEAPACGPKLGFDGNNQIFYEAKQGAWRIDVAKRTYEPYLWEGKGNGFDIEYDRSPVYGHRILYQGAEIGRCWCDSVRTSPGRIAVAFGSVGSNLGYPEGVKVWSASERVWSTVKPEWLTAVIGWVEE